jgi:predicted DNA-binding transcriptional regulator AlpA
MRIDTDDVIDAAEAAPILGLSNPKGVSVYRGRHADFPAPVIEKGRCVLWLRKDIERWAARRGSGGSGASGHGQH